MLAATKPRQDTIAIDGRSYRTDEWFNVPANIVGAVSKKLHLQVDHPLDVTRRIIESRFPSREYNKTSYNDLFPVVSTLQNFDSLGFPTDHPGRNRTDTYYINKNTVLRTHTSAHQADVFRENRDYDGFLISAGVYRRDAIDKSHYPVFHQMEGARLWDRRKVSSSSDANSVAEAVLQDVHRLPTHGGHLLQVEDPSPTVDPINNPLQAEHHSLEEAEAIAAHLKRTLEGVVLEIFSRAREAAIASSSTSSTTTAPATLPAALQDEPLRVRWVPSYFPFTSPSWELEVFWEGDWLELLGCGVIKQDLLVNANVPSKLGWAFGVGLERIAMLLFSIPDIRLFWSRDPRFLSQFTGLSSLFSSSSQNNAPKLSRYVSFSKHPACYKDVAFWLPPTGSNDVSPLLAQPEVDGPGEHTFHINDMMELVRSTASDNVEDVRLVDSFTHPRTGRTSLCYRVNYRRLDRTLTNDEANALHEQVRQKLVEDYGVELR